MNDAHMKQETGAAIRLLRKKKGLSQKALADLASCSRDTIMRIENGTRDAHPHTLHNILGVLGVSFEAFSSHIYGTDMQAFNDDFARVWDAGFAGEYDTMAILLAELKCKGYYDVNIPTIAQAVLLCEGVLASAYNEYSKSLEMLYDALQLTTASILSECRKLSYIDISASTLSINEYRILKGIAKSKFGAGQHQESIDIYQAIITSLERKNTGYELQKKLLPGTYFNMSNRLLDLKCYDSAFDITNHAVDFCHKAKEFKLIGHLLCNKGRVFYYMGNIEQATFFLQKSYETFVTHGDTSSAEHLKKIAMEKYGIIAEH